MYTSGSVYDLDDFSAEHDASEVDICDDPGVLEHNFLNSDWDLDVPTVQFPSQVSEVGTSPFGTNCYSHSITNYSTDSQEHIGGNHSTLADAIDYILGPQPLLINEENTDFLGMPDWHYGAASMGTIVPCGPSMPVVNPIAGPETRALRTAEVNVPPPSPPTLFRVHQARYVHPSARGRARFGRPTNVDRDMVSFRINGASQDGVPLKMASMNFIGTAMSLVEADELVLLDAGIGVNITLHVLWPGQKPWKRLLRTKAWSNPREAISRAELVKRLARALISFTESATPLAQNPSEVDPLGSTPGCPAPGSLSPDQIIIERFYPVTKGAWQVDLSYKPVD